MKKQKKYEVTRIGVRDDKVVNKGKAIAAVGAVVALVGVGVMASGRQWFAPDDFYAKIGGPSNDCDESEDE